MKYIFTSIILCCVVLMPILCSAHKLSLQDEYNESEIFFEPEQQPSYLHGGNEGLMNDLYTTLSKTAPVTQDSIKGRAFVTFVIAEEGLIDPNSIKVIRNNSVPEDYLNAAIEAIKNLSKFEPGKMNGVPKRVSWNMSIIYPIPFDLIETRE